MLSCCCGTGAVSKCGSNLSNTEEPKVIVEVLIIGSIEHEVDGSGDILLCL